MKTIRLLDQAVDSLSILLFVKNADNDFRYEWANKTFSDFFGIAPKQLIGRNDAELFPASEILDDILEHNLAALDAPDGITYEKEWHDRNGVAHKFRIMLCPFQHENGTRMLSGAAENITELRNRIDEEKLITRALAVFLHENDFRKSIDRVLKIVSENIQCDRMFFATFNESDSRYTVLESRTQADGYHDVSEEQPFVDCFCGIADASLKAGHIFTLTNSPGGMYQEFLEQNRLNALFLAPIFQAGHLGGAIAIGFSKTEDSRIVNNRFMESLADLIALALLRERSTQSLRRVDSERQTVIDNINTPVWLFDRNAQMISCNRFVQNMVKLPQEEILKHPCYELFKCDNYAKGMCPVQMTRNDSKPHRVECAYGGHDFIIDSQPVLDAKGHLLNIIKSGMDVTELNTVISDSNVINNCLETLLCESDMDVAILKALKMLCDHIGAARTYIFRFDTVKKQVSCYREFIPPGKAPIFGEVQNQPYRCKPEWEERFAETDCILLTDLQVDGRREGIGPQWLDFLSGNNIRSVYCRRLMLDGKFWGYVGMAYEGEMHPLAERDFNFIRYAAHFIELMIHRERTHSELLQALNQAQTAEKAKSFFIASVSHEIRTPLNAIIGFSELLQSDSVTPDDRKDYLRSIQFAGTSLLQIINDVLDLSKLEADRMEITQETTNFMTLAFETLKIFKHRADEKRLSLISKVYTMPLLELDRLRVRQILFNLLGNAVKFTQTGKVTLMASFQPDNAETGTLTFAVCDTGIGISEEGLAQLAKPYVQVSRIRSEDAVINGTGMGLAISKQLVEKMGGKLLMTSELGKGSCFEVVIPGVRVSTDEETSQESALEGKITESGEHCSVLLVDDVPLNLKVLGAMCRKLGVAVVDTASSGPEALLKLANGKYDLVLTDMWMPGMSGAELACTIRANEKFATLPIIAVTADIEAKDNFDMTCFSGVLQKPVTLEKVRLIIENFIKQR